MRVFRHPEEKMPMVATRLAVHSCALLAMSVASMQASTAQAALTFSFTNGSSLTALQSSNPTLYNNVVNGFIAAGNRWSAIFNDNANVRVTIDFPSLGAGILGSAGSNQVVYSYPTYRAALQADRTSTDDFTGYASLPTGSTFTVRRRNIDTPGTFITETSGAIASNVVVNQAHARALGLYSGTASDASISFSSNFSWDFDPSNGVSSGTFDFIGVATHELGHAMGFVSTVDDFDFYGEGAGPQRASLADSSVPGFAWLNPLDLYRYSSNGIRDVSYNLTSYFSLNGGASNLGNFSTGSYNGDGWQASHWFEQTPTLGIMDPAIASATVASIQSRDIVALDTIGWSRVPEPSTLLVCAGVAVAALGRKRR
jgi:hypothetical protein